LRRCFRCTGGQVSEACLRRRASRDPKYLGSLPSPLLRRPCSGERGSRELALVWLRTPWGLTGDLIPTWPHNLVQAFPGMPHAAVCDHPRGRRDPSDAGELAARMGKIPPGDLPLRSAAALSLRRSGGQGRPRTGCARRDSAARGGALAARWASRCTPSGLWRAAARGVPTCSPSG